MRLAESRYEVSFCFLYVAAVVIISQEKCLPPVTQFFRIKYQIGNSIAVPIIIRPMKLYATCRIEIRGFFLFLIRSSGRLHLSRKVTAARDTIFSNKISNREFNRCSYYYSANEIICDLQNRDPRFLSVFDT